MLDKKEYKRIKKEADKELAELLLTRPHMHPDYMIKHAYYGVLDLETAVNIVGILVEVGCGRCKNTVVIGRKTAQEVVELKKEYKGSQEEGKILLVFDTCEYCESK